MFFIGMCLWGSQRVPNLKYSNSTVLPSMLQVRFVINYGFFFYKFLKVSHYYREFFSVFHVRLVDLVNKRPQTKLTSWVSQKY